MRSTRQLTQDDMRFFFVIGCAVIITLSVFIFATISQGKPSQRSILFSGVYQSEDVVEWSGDRVYPSPYFGLLEIEGAEFGHAISSAGTVTFRTYGTDVWLREIGDYQVIMDGEFRPFTEGNERTWQQVLIFKSLLPEIHEFSISCVTLCPVRIDSITVLDRSLGYFPLIVGSLAVLIWFLSFMVRLQWERRQR